MAAVGCELYGDSMYAPSALPAPAAMNQDGAEWVRLCSSLAGTMTAW